MAASIAAAPRSLDFVMADFLRKRLQETVAGENSREPRMFRIPGCAIFKPV
jgi:hypothetical protein